MGLLLAVPTIIIFNTIRRKYFSSSHDYESSGMMQQAKQCIISVLLKIPKLWQTKRIQNNVHETNGDIDKIGIVPLQSDRKLEYPSTQIPQCANIIDGVCLSGFNSKGDCLIVRLGRRSGDKVEVFLYLKLADGSKFHLPLVPDTRGYVSDGENFSCNGLKIQCLSAMNRWRISFNGFLRRNRECEQEDAEIVHVRFSFIWVSGSLAYDFQTDFDCGLLAEALSEDTFPSLRTINDLKQRLDCYEHWGQFLGTVSIDTQDEKEMYLWGPRTRNRGIMDWKEFKDYLKIYGQMDDGTRFHLGTLSIPGVVSNLKYGYIVLPDHFIHPIQSCYYDAAAEGEKVPDKIIFNAGGKTYDVYYYRSNDGCDAYYGDEWNIHSKLRYTTFVLNGIEGKGFVEIGTRNDTVKPGGFPQAKPCLLREPEIRCSKIPLVVDFKEELCQSSKVSGGKGSSLAMLKKLSASRQNQEQQSVDTFIVPNGIVVTSAAYRHHLEANTNLSPEISSLTSKRNLKELEEASKSVMNAFTKTTLSDILKTKILTKIQDVFSENLSEKMFAVRSSASGEDSEDTSAAGQMDTYLGIRSIDKIYENIVKCWSSQFSLTAVNYKRQTGQVIDSDMAVVVQDMVPAEIAGVVFTCDPMTGNPGNVTITANYGLGESVVSAAAEPDTIILRRSVDDGIALHSKTIGRKALRIQIENEGGVSTKDVLDEDSKKCCLEEEGFLKIGRIAVMVERAFGNPRDIEWAIVGQNVYLLQARPITTCGLETDFEIAHELDTGILTEFEYLSRANVGEVMPGAITPLTITSITKAMDLAFQQAFLQQFGPHFVYHPGFPAAMSSYACNSFFNIVEVVLRQVTKEKNVMSYGWQWALLGRTLENFDELLEIALHRYGEYPALRGIRNLISSVIDSFYIRKNLEIASKEVMDSYLPEDMKFVSSFQLYTIIGQMLPKHCKPSRIHSDSSGSSSLYNILILGIMSHATKDMSERLFADFSKLLSNCENVESADVPQSIKNLADSIILYGAKGKILKMTPEEADKWLQEENGQLGAKYREFLRTHGHRCLKEFDLWSLPWSMNTASLVKSLQSMIRQPNDRARVKRNVNTPTSAVNQLSLPLNTVSKLFLKVLVRWARLAVCEREASKSVLIRSVDTFRKAYRRLGQMMSEEGRIPEPDLIFFLTHEEIGELLKSRSARLISKAIRRKRMHPKLNALRFPEISKGPPQPIKVQNSVVENGVSDWIIRATPVSQGQATAPARVIVSLEDAHEIQPGEILVACSTDIGWTPYFPMLAGVVTELGGLISHGAVVAREFGLPCVVGAVNATSIVKTGDLVILDGKEGTLKISKID